MLLCLLGAVCQAQGPKLGANGKPLEEPTLSSLKEMAEIIDEPPEETVPERRDAPPLPMPPLVHTENSFDTPAKRIFVQATRTMPPLPALPAVTFDSVPPYIQLSSADSGNNVHNSQYKHTHNTKHEFRLKNPLVEEENEERAANGNDDEKDASMEDYRSERQKERERIRFEDEKSLLRKSARLEAEHDEVLIRERGEEEVEEKEAEEEEQAEDASGGDESSGGESGDKRYGEVGPSAAIASKLKDQAKLIRNAQLRVDSEATPK